MNPMLSLGQQTFYYSVQVPRSTPDPGTAAGSLGVPPGGQAAQAGQPENGGQETGKTGRDASGRRNFDTYECQTCKNRKYQDGSDDPGVSFKTPTHISPENAASAIRSHEEEHVSHARSEALDEDKDIISQSVTYHTAICPECGRVYMSGGTTQTVFREASDAYQGEPEQKGRYLDMTA